ncbi:MAG TPA: Na/Pi cotransporter family protein [Sulfurovum sp.]|nr:Na/Pi cotransporter family protein [Sulfurovum sp.]
MLRKIIFPSILLVLAYGFWISPDFKEIAAGMSIFLFGMLSLEEGFRAFSGGTLEKILKKSTDKLYKSIGFGIIATTLMQSSTLVSVLTISFLGAGLIGLAQGIGIIFGANIGTTTGAWLIAGLGLKVKISAYAMPMLVFGVIFIFQKSKSLKGIGYILAGLGFLFLGIHYMKDGFEAFKNTIDLSSFAVSGYKGLFIFTGIGIFATVVMQSSHATLVLIIAALAAGQITYENGLALAIGANVGTTITAIISSMSSNIEGKRLAGAHLIFNLVTGLIAIGFIYQLMDVVDWVSANVGIASDNYTLKLAVFHTIFNLIGAMVMVPFIGKLVTFLESTFKKKVVDDQEIEKAEYLNDSALEFPSTAVIAASKEAKRLYDNAFDIITKGINIKKENLLSNMNMEGVIRNPYSPTPIDINAEYNHKLKGIYGEIIDFASKAQSDMPQEYAERMYDIKLACRSIIECIKITERLQKNIRHYDKSGNTHIQEQYQKITKRIGKLLRKINDIANTDEEDEILIAISKAKLLLKKNDIISNGKFDKLIREDLITNEMATSLMNDSEYTNNIIRNLISVAELLFIDLDSDLNEFDDEMSISDEEIDTILDKGDIG